MLTGRRRDSLLSSVRSLANTLIDRNAAPERMHRLGRGPHGHSERTYVSAVRLQGSKLGASCDESPLCERTGRHPPRNRDYGPWYYPSH
jgi:hypothetical protein